jgi:hypothetical protein
MLSEVPGLVRAKSSAVTACCTLASYLAKRSCSSSSSSSSMCGLVVAVLEFAVLRALSVPAGSGGSNAGYWVGGLMGG